MGRPAGPGADKQRGGPAGAGAERRRLQDGARAGPACRRRPGHGARRDAAPEHDEVRRQHDRHEPRRRLHPGRRQPRRVFGPLRGGQIAPGLAHRLPGRPALRGGPRRAEHGRPELDHQLARQRRRSPRGALPGPARSPDRGAVLLRAGRPARRVATGVPPPGRDVRARAGRSPPDPHPSRQRGDPRRRDHGRRGPAAVHRQRRLRLRAAAPGGARRAGGPARGGSGAGGGGASSGRADAGRPQGRGARRLPHPDLPGPRRRPRQRPQGHRLARRARPGRRRHDRDRLAQGSAVGHLRDGDRPGPHRDRRLVRPPRGRLQHPRGRRGVQRRALAGCRARVLAGLGRRHDARLRGRARQGQPQRRRGGRRLDRRRAARGGARDAGPGPDGGRAGDGPPGRPGRRAPRHRAVDGQGRARCPGRGAADSARPDRAGAAIRGRGRARPRLRPVRGLRRAVAGGSAGRTCVVPVRPAPPAPPVPCAPHHGQAARQLPAARHAGLRAGPHPGAARRPGRAGDA